MTKEEAINYLQQLYPNGGHCWLDKQRIEAIGMAVEALKEEPVSDDTMTIRKDWFEHCKKSWYNEGYIDGKHNRDSQFGEPVSEDLEEELSRLLKDCGIDSEYIHQDFLHIVANHFADWQKKQLMASGTEVTVHIEAGNYPYIPQIELYDYDKDIPLAKEGDKYKVVLIKEE